MSTRTLLMVYRALALVLVVCVGYQVFLAGMAVFVDAFHWIRHVSFVHYFEWIPIALLALAFGGKLPKGQGLYVRPTLLLILIGLQYASAGSGRGVWGALHPVNALVIFGLAVALALNIPLVRSER